MIHVTDRLRFVKEKDKTIDGVMLQAVQVLYLL